MFCFVSLEGKKISTSNSQHLMAFSLLNMIFGEIEKVDFFLFHDTLKDSLGFKFGSSG